jgi:protein kinase
MDKYRIIEKLGDGSYGSVHKAEDKETKEIVAIKKMKRKYTNWDECKNLREVKSLNSLKHDNIIKIKEMIREEDILSLVFEYMESNLYELMTSKGNKKFREDEIKTIIFQIVNGIAYMHKYGFFHRDMKPENILVKNKLIVKLADFGLAREIRSIPPYTEYVSTRWYRAPECLLSTTNYNSPIDIWAIGTIMAELYLLKPIFPGNNNKDMLLKISKVIGAPSINSWPEGLKASKKIDFKFPNSGQFGKENLNKEFSIRNMIKNASPEAICFMEDLLQWDPNKRPTASELLCHPFLKDFEFRINQNENILSGVRKKEIDERADNKERNETLSRSKIGSKKSNDDIGTPFILKSNK